MNKIEELLASSGEGQKEVKRAELRVDVTEAILLLMEKKGISKSELADILGVTRSAITQALSSSRNLSLNLIADISSALGATVKFDIHVATQEARVPQAQAAATAHAPQAVAEVLFPAERHATNSAIATTGTAKYSEITLH
jgi:transcriptional regulator with XRE-family HTH domain